MMTSFIPFQVSFAATSEKCLPSASKSSLKPASSRGRGLTVTCAPGATEPTDVENPEPAATTFVMGEADPLIKGTCAASKQNGCRYDCERYSHVCFLMAMCFKALCDTKHMTTESRNCSRICFAWHAHLFVTPMNVDAHRRRGTRRTVGRAVRAF
jgi:hypothetical protein